ncbi:tail fiber assembly protein [Lelliottia amnigena]|uniref:tail fiber assembly protein n=1 Tax=Lelliottia amnigena TaxID=61646 RepID=UPI00192C13E8|nr:tail fiber assembly protein [Lelliottia amnigena]MBL5965939.1 tail fiber assembly protein [Lelliottia amnigena]
MNTYKFSSNIFYPYALEQDYRAAGTWPDDGCDVSDAVYREFTAEPPPGKMRITGVDGMPAWQALPPLTKEQLVNLMEQQRQMLRSKADLEISWRQDAADAGMITEKEMAELALWKTYRVLVMRLDSSTVPKIIWPSLPETINN